MTNVQSQALGSVARAICFCFNLLGVYESTNRSRDLCQQFSSFVMIFSLVYINLSGTDVLCWCVDELFRCVRDILRGGEIRASCVTLYKYGWRNSGWATMKAMCVLLLKLDWSFSSCVAVGLDVA